MKFYIITNIGSPDCSVSEFNNLDDAANMYKEYKFSNPILTQSIHISMNFVARTEHNSVEAIKTSFEIQS